MRRFKNILFVTGEEAFTPLAFTKAVGFAVSNDAAITVMDVVDSIPQRRRLFETASAVHDLQDILVTDSHRRIEEMIEGIAVADRPSPEVVVTSGEHHIEIIRRIISADHDLVIVADAEEGYDATTHHLLRKAPCPVWLMTPSIAHQQRLLAAVDPNPVRPAQELLNDDVLTLAIGLADLESGPLHIVHAWNVPGGASLGLSISERSALRDDTRAEHSASLTALLDRHDLPDDAVIHFLEGDPDKVIRQVMFRNNITTIVMGTVARSGISGLIIGNTAERILRRANCSVLAIKPEGFETPVRIS